MLFYILYLIFYVFYFIFYLIVVSCCNGRPWIPYVFLFNVVEAGILLPQSAECVGSWCLVRATLTQCCKKSFVNFQFITLLGMWAMTEQTLRLMWPRQGMDCPYIVTCLEKKFFVEAGQRPYLPAVASLSILLFSVKKSSAYLS